MDSSCPKCGAAGKHFKREGWQYECGTVTVEWQEDRLVQSDRCRIRELEQESKRLIAAVTKHHSQHADDLCWMDDDELYAAFGLPARHATVGDPRAMLQNCKRFIRQRCQGAGDWKSYAELEQENERLQRDLDGALQVMSNHDIPLSGILVMPIKQAVQIELLKAENERLSSLNVELTERVAAQSELLSKRAEKG